MNFGDPNEWGQLLEPYGYANVMFSYPFQALKGTPPFRVEIELILKEGNPTVSEFAQRAVLLGQAHDVIRLIQRKGLKLDYVPSIVFDGGRYIYELDSGKPIGAAPVTCRMELTAITPSKTGDSK